MPVTSATQKLFFMTQQGANLMEDLDLQCHTQGAICILFGQKGVGKTRLLQEFIDTRLTDQRKIVIRFSTDGTCSNSLQKAQRFPQQEFLTLIFDSMKLDSILVLDQFEYATEDSILKIFQFWKAEWKPKNLKLIISCTHQAVSQLATLSQQFQLSVNSVELKPLNRVERIEFLRSQYCSGTRRSIELPGNLKRLIKSSDGVFSELESISRKYGQQISCKEKAALSWLELHASFIPLLIILGLLSVFAFITQNDTTPISSSGEGARLFDTLNSQSAIEKKPETAVLAGSELVARAQSEVINDRLEADSKEIKEDQSTIVENNLQPTQETINPPILIDEYSAQTTDLPVESILQQRIQATRQWLAVADNSEASIQLMTLMSSSTTKTSVNQYLEDLKKSEIDLNSIYVYSINTDKMRIYGVLFGRYMSRDKAITGITSLPEGLKANQPIPRTVKGIKDEMIKGGVL